MNNFKLSRITSKFDRGLYKMYQFGYDDEGKFVTKVDTFKDYFYYSAKHIDDILFGKKIVGIPDHYIILEIGVGSDFEEKYKKKYKVT